MWINHKCGDNRCLHSYGGRGAAVALLFIDVPSRSRLGAELCLVNIYIAALVALLIIDVSSRLNVHETLAVDYVVDTFIWLIISLLFPDKKVDFPWLSRTKLTFLDSQLETHTFSPKRFWFSHISALRLWLNEHFSLTCVRNSNYFPWVLSYFQHFHWHFLNSLTFPDSSWLSREYEP